MTTCVLIKIADEVKKEGHSVPSCLVSRFPNNILIEMLLKNQIFLCHFVQPNYLKQGYSLYGAEFVL